MASADEDVGELVRRTLRGGADGEEAFRGLVERYLASVTGYIFQMLGRGDVARDLAQEAFAEAYRGLRDLRQPGKFGAWVGIIARRRAIYWLRRERRERAVLADAAVEAAERDRRAQAPPGSGLEREELRRAVRRAILELPEKYREVLVLKHLDNRPGREIAEMLGLSGVGVEKRLSRARALLREKLRRLGLG